MMKRIIPIVAVIVIVLLAGAYFFLHKPAVDPTAWKTYTNKEFGFSFQYPPTFTVEENRNADGGSFSVGVGDPATHAGYLSVMLWLQQHSVDEVSEYFTGPYPKEIPASGNNSARQVVERTLAGVKGIEYYGYGGEGTSYDDVFMYKNKYLWALYLDGVMEGRITEEREPGAPVPDKAIYDRILSSVRIY